MTESSEAIETASDTPSAEELGQWDADYSSLPEETQTALIAFADKVRQTPQDGSPTYIRGGSTFPEFLDSWRVAQPSLVESLGGWPDESGATALRALNERWDWMVDNAYFDLNPTDTASWFKRHRPEAGVGDKSIRDATTAVVACIELVPPREIRIKGRMAQTGAQKIVFDAEWQLGEERRPVVLKRFIDPDEQQVLRESRNHPLVTQHPNIINTYRFQNVVDDDFLVERKLSDVLEDKWSARGYHEAARLLADIARALAFLDGQGFVHGDVKPDNIGIKDGNFVLLDFGVARPWIKFLGQAASGTGSLRTRAPEVLRREMRHSGAADVWSLGATVFRALPEIGRFPLFEAADEAPPPADPDDPESSKRRDEFRQMLCERVENDWDRLVLDPLTELKKQRNLRLGELLERMLAREPADRISAGDALDEALRNLSGLIGEADGPLFSPLREARQFTRYLARETVELRSIPRIKAIAWNERVDHLKQGLEAERAEEQLSAELLTYCGTLKQALSEDAYEALSVLELDLRRHDGGEPLYKALLSEIQNRIDIAHKPGAERESKLPDWVEDTLADSVDHALRFSEIAGFESFTPVAQALLAILREAS